MSRIDRKAVIRWIVTHPDNKGTDKPDPDFTTEADGVFAELRIALTNMTLGTAASWLLHMDRLLTSGHPMPKLQRGQVVDVDLGANFEGEMSFKHPCIVLRSVGNWAIVVPSTSQRFGNGILVDVAQGTVASAPSNPEPRYQNQVDFVMPTSGIASSAMTEQVRMVSKERVIKLWLHPGKTPWQKGPIVQVDPLVLKTMDDRLARLVAPGALYDKDQEIKQLRGQVAILTDEAAKMQAAMAKQADETGDIVAD